MIAVDIREDDYRIAASVAAFTKAGEFGPLPCGCCLVALQIDPVGPRLCLFMEHRAASPHAHDLADFDVHVLADFDGKDDE